MFLLILLYIANTNGSAVTRTDFFGDQVIPNNYSLNNVFSLENSTNITMQNYELVGFVSSLNKHSHSPISLTNLVDKYQKQLQGFYIGLFQILYEDYNSAFIVDEYFNAVNDHLHGFSEHSKSYCLDTMSAINALNVFDRLTESPKGSKGPQVQENNISPKTHPKGAFLFAAAAAFVTGDISAPVSVVADMMSVDKPKEKANKAESKEKAKEKDNTLNQAVSYAFSRIYCINTFSLQFTLDDNNDLFIIGDKIGYEYFINYMTLIQSNLPSFSESDKTKNVWEQVEALKRVATKMDELVVYELYDKISDISSARFNPFPKLKTYISSKLLDIDRLKNLLDTDFPISKLYLAEQVRLNTATRHIKVKIREEELKKHADELLNARQDSDQKVSKDLLQNELNGNEFEAFANLHVYGPLKRTTKLLTRAVIALPEGVTVGGLQGIYDFLGSIWTIFSGSPVTSTVITIGGLAVIYSSVTTIACSIFNFVSWVFFPFLFVKKFVCRLFC
jgi:hypothetical protein